VNIQAGKDVTIQASDVISGQNTKIIGADVNITAGRCLVVTKNEVSGRKKSDRPRFHLRCSMLPSELRSFLKME
jgi:hypothetical protein